MPNIPQIYRDKIASSLVGTPGVDTSGQQLGQEIAQGAEAVAKPMWDTAIKKQTLEDGAETNLLVAHNKMNVETLLETYKDKYANNPEEAGKHFWTDVKALQDQTVAQASNYRVKQLVTQRDPLFDGRIAATLGAWQYHQRDQLTVDNINATADRLGQDAYETASDNKLDYAEQSRRLFSKFDVAGHLVASLDPSHPERQAKFTKQISEALYKNTIDGYIDANPARALQFLNEKHTKDFIPGDMIEKFKSDAIAHLGGMQKRAELESLSKVMVEQPAKVAGIDSGEITFGSLTRDDPQDKLPGSKELKLYALKTQFESQVEDASMVLGMHDKAYQLGLEARGLSGDEKKDRRPASESIQSLIDFQTETLRMKPYMSSDAFKTFQREVTGPLTALVAHLHTPGWGEQLTGMAQNYWRNGPFGDKSKAEFKVDSFAQGYNEIASLAKAQDKGNDAEYKLAALRKYYEKMNEISGQPGARDPSGLPYNPRSVAREVMGVGVGKPWPLTVSGKTYMIPVKSWSAPGVPVFDGKDLPPELNFGENK